MKNAETLAQEFEQWKIEETNRIKKIYEDKLLEFQEDLAKQINGQKNGLNSAQDQKEQILTNIINEIQELSDEYDAQMLKKAQLEEEIKQNYSKIEVKPIQIDTNREARIGRISELRFNKEYLIKENEQLKLSIAALDKSIKRYDRLFNTTNNVVIQALKEIKKNKKSVN